MRLGYWLMPRCMRFAGMALPAPGWGWVATARFAPSAANVQSAIIENFAGLGVETIIERHLEDPGNYSFAEHSAAKVDALVREAASAKPDAIVIHCTNFRGLPGAVGIEAETGIPILDSVAVALWGAIRAAGRNPAMIQGAGRLFSL